MNNTAKNISVIIPAFNEEKHIKNTLLALSKNSNLDIIVVDNGSTDKTAEIANNLGARVIECPAGTIAAVRNRGVSESGAEILVFIDADITVAEDWHEKLDTVIQKLIDSPLCVTGSRVRSIGNDNWLNKYWYSELVNYSAPYINSGHMITTRFLFNKVEGFTENLETAEDYDFCQKAIRAGATIDNNPALVAVHDGYPETIAGFIQRERWHGRQDVQSLSLFMDSKIAWIASFNLILLISSFCITMLNLYLGTIIYLLLMYVVSLLLTIYKFGFKKINYMLIMPVIFYLYLCGRSLAIVDRVGGQLLK
jgi:glycosyltransferase involved in cell wall biosynthesis